MPYQFNPFTGTLDKVRDAEASRADKLDATAAPTANDDGNDTSGNGAFSVGSMWIDTTNDEAYRCLDASTGAAVWVKTTLDSTELGTLAFQDVNAVNITGGSVTGITDLAIADGGTGASTAADARTNLGLAIGTDVQAYDATLQSLSALGTAADRLAYTTGIDTWAETPLTTFGRSLIDDADAATARTTLGVSIGTDVQAYSANLDIYASNALTAAEIQQLQNIGTSTISATQWGYLGAMNQSVATGTNVSFNSMNVNSAALGTVTCTTIDTGQGANELYAMDQNVRTSDNVTFNQITGTLQTAAQANITSVGTLTALDVDNINIDGNTISTTDTNGNLTLAPNGTGDVIVSSDFRVQSSGNASMLLESTGSGDLFLDFQRTTAGTDYRFVADGTGGGHLRIQSSADNFSTTNDIFATDSGNTVELYTAGTQALHIDNSQNVGIGTTTQSTGTAGGKRLVVDGGASGTGYFGVFNGSGTASHIAMHSASDGNIYNVFNDTGNYLIGTGNKDTTSFSEILRITNGGVIGVNEGSPDADAGGITLKTGDGRLKSITVKNSARTHPFTTHVENDTAMTIGASLGGSQISGLIQTFGDTGFSFYASAYAQTPTTDGSGGVIMFQGWKSDGGTSRTALANTEDLFRVRNALGSTILLLKGGGTSAVSFPTYGAGTLTTDANGVITASSDIAKKENVESYTAGLNEILNLESVTYNWKKETKLDTKNKYAGFIAQQVEEAGISHAVFGEDGEKTLSDRAIIAALVNAVKELNDKIS